MYSRLINVQCKELRAGADAECNIQLFQEHEEGKTYINHRGHIEQTTETSLWNGSFICSPVIIPRLFFPPAANSVCIWIFLEPVVASRAQHSRPLLKAEHACVVFFSTNTRCHNFTCKEVVAPSQVVVPLHFHFHLNVKITP